MSRAANGVRCYLLLKWIDALEKGYGSYNGVKQPPTTSNLAYFILREDAMKDLLTNTHDRMELREPFSADALDYTKTLVCHATRNLHGLNGVNYDTCDRTEDTHIEMRKRSGTQPQSGIRKYVSAGDADEMIEWYRDKFERKRKAAKRSTFDITHDTIRYPEQDGTLWNIESFSIPRIDDDGKDIETGKSVTQYI